MRNTTVLLAVVAILPGLSLIVETRPAIAAGVTQRCCLLDGNCIMLTPATCLSILPPLGPGVPGGPGSSCSDGPCPGAACPWDCGGDNDGNVGIVDLLAVLAQWGTPGSCDFDGCGVVGITDLLALLANWGLCP